MATTIPNNPFDTNQTQTTGAGNVVGSLANTAQSGLVSSAIGGTSNNNYTLAPAPTVNLEVNDPTMGLQTQRFTPQSSTVNAATETTAGQLDSILAKDSPLMQRARTIAAQNMNQRGLVNSSMAQGAGVAAMIDRATPIAQQDASIYSNRTLANTDAANQGGQFNVNQNNQLVGQKIGIEATKEQQKAQQDFQAQQGLLDRAQQLEVARFQAGTQTSLQGTQQQFQATQANLEREQQTALTELQNKLNNENVSKNFAANITASTLASINQIQADPNLTPEAKKAAVDNIIATANSTLAWGSTFYNTPLPTIAAPGGTAGTVSPGAMPGTTSTNRPATAADIAAAYQQYLGRPPENADVVQARIDAGLTVDQIRQHIASSPEATQRVLSTGGAAPAPAPAAPAPAPVASAAELFASRGATGDAGGVQYWQDRLSSGEDPAQVAREFNASYDYVMNQR